MTAPSGNPEGQEWLDRQWQREEQRIEWYRQVEALRRGFRQLGTSMVGLQAAMVKAMQPFVKIADQLAKRQPPPSYLKHTNPRKRGQRW